MKIATKFTTAITIEAEQWAASVSPQFFQQALAIYIVDYYCRYLDIPTNFSTHQEIIRANLNLLGIAALEFIGLGMVECIYLQPGKENFEIPQTAQEGRIAYLFVEIDEEQGEAIISKFLPAFSSSEEQDFTPQNLTNFLDYLEKLELGVELLKNEAATDLSKLPAELVINSLKSPNNQEVPEKLRKQLQKLWQSPEQESCLSIPENTTVIKLSSWFKDIQSIFDSGWQTIEAFKNINTTFVRLPERTRSLKFDPKKASAQRAAIKRVKVGKYEVGLIVLCRINTSGDSTVTVRVIPLLNYLPSGFELSVCTGTESPLISVKARGYDSWIQVVFAKPINRFRVDVTIDSDNESCYFE